MLTILFVLLLYHTVTVTSTTATPTQIIPSYQYDSAGTDFLTIFTWNNGNRTDTQTIKFVLINPNNENATVNITAKSILNSGITTEQTNVYGLSEGFVVITFLGTNFANYINDTVHGLQTYPDLSVTIKSNIPISLVLDTYLENECGDFYTVLPTSMAGKYYALSVPKTYGKSVVYFLPTGKEPVKVNAHFVQENTTKDEIITLTPGNGLVNAYVTNLQTSLYLSGNASFVVVAAVSKLPIQSGSPTYDYGTFMPTPLPDIECLMQLVSNDHPTTLHSSSSFLVTSPTDKCISKVGVFGDDGNVMMTVINGSRPSEILSFNDDKGSGLNFESNNSLIQVMRYGGYNAQDRINGSFLDNVLSYSQFITGKSTFYVPSVRNNVTIIMDSYLPVSIDNSFIDNYAAWSSFSYSGVNFVHFTITQEIGLHYFNFNSHYIIYVSGEMGDSAYGYVPVFNKMQPTAGTATVPSGTKPGTTVKTGTTAKPKAANKATSTLFLILLPFSFRTII